MTSFDVIIVGAGIIGCACARECARAGLSVAILEGGTSANASSAGMGHLVVMDDSPAQLALTIYSRTLWVEEAKALPAAAEYECPGTIWVAADGEEMAEVYAKQKIYSAAGVTCEVLDSVSLGQQEPNLRSGLAGGLLVPDDGVVYPPAMVAFYLKEAQRFGTILYQSRAISAAKGRVVLTDGTRLEAERIVLAVGTECELLPTIPVQKRKGHLIIADRYPGFLRHQLVELGYLKSAHKLASDSVAFNVQPRQTGQLLIGSSRQYGDEDTGVNEVVLRRMVERASSYMPGLAALSVLRVWTGFRASTLDKLPLIGPAEGLSDDPSIWLAVGFEGLGITNAPGAAQLLVDGLLRRDSKIDAAPFLPSRVSLMAKVAHA